MYANELQAENAKKNDVMKRNRWHAEEMELSWRFNVLMEIHSFKSHRHFVGHIVLFHMSEL